MMMADCVAEHTPDEIHRHLLRCQGVDSFRHWDRMRRPELVSAFVREQPTGDLYCLDRWLRARSTDPESYHLPD